MTTDESDRTAPIEEEEQGARRTELLSALWERHHGTNAARVEALESAALALVDGNLPSSLREDAKSRGAQAGRLTGHVRIRRGNPCRPHRGGAPRSSRAGRERAVAVCRRAHRHRGRRGGSRTRPRRRRQRRSIPPPSNRPVIRNSPTGVTTPGWRKAGTGAKSCWSPAIRSSSNASRLEQRRSVVGCSAPGTAGSSGPCFSPPA